jgi:hypothetical protein
VTREISLTDAALEVRYTGFDAFLALIRRVRIPYSDIQSVNIGLDEVPRFPALRAGAAIPFTDIWKGRFWTRGRRWFLDFKDRRRAVVLRLRPGARFDVVAIQPDDPDALAEELRRRTSRPPA